MRQPAVGQVWHYVGSNVAEIILVLSRVSATPPTVVLMLWSSFNTDLTGKVLDDYHLDLSSPKWELLSQL